jgi:hypothetical protein
MFVPSLKCEIIPGIKPHFKRMPQTLNYAPGQQATIVFQTLNSLGQRADGYQLPTITQIIFPTLQLAANYPAPMTRLDVGLFVSNFTLPVLATAVGTYIVDILYLNPDTSTPENDYVQINVQAPFGQYTASTF